MNTDRLQRNFKKLLRDPKGFFKDSKVLPTVIKRDTPELIKPAISHNSIGKIFLNDDNAISINFVGSKKPTNQAFSSIVIKERKCSSPRNEPIYSNILDNPNNFIGFRGTNISLLDAHENTLDSFLDFKEAFQNKFWLSTPFSSYKRNLPFSQGWQSLYTFNVNLLFSVVVSRSRKPSSVILYSR